MEIQIKQTPENKRFVLANAGYQTIYEAKKDLGGTASQVYDYLFSEYNRITSQIRKGEIKKKVKREFANKLQEIKTEIMQKKAEKYFDKEKREARKEETKQYKTFISDIEKGNTANLKIEILHKKNMTLNNLIELILKKSPFKQILIEIDGVKYALNDETIVNLQKYINKKHEVLEEGQGSDAEITSAFSNGQKTINVIPFETKSHNKKDNGAFFKYLNKTKLDLSRYGVYQVFDIKDHKDTCLIHALNISDEKKELLKSMVKSRNIPISSLSEICNRLEIQIHLRQKDSKNLKKYGSIGEINNVGIIDGHYFVLEDVDITSYALLHYDEVKDQVDWNKIYKDKFYKSNDRKISSFQVISILLENPNLIEPISFENSMIASSQFYKETIQEITTLTEIEKNSSPAWDEEKSVIPEALKHMFPEDKFLNVFFDFETYTESDGETLNKHFAYLCCFTIPDYDLKGSFIGEDCSLKMLNKCCNSARKDITGIRFIAHNAGYDLNFLIQKLFRISIIQRGTHLINANAIFSSYGRMFKIQIKDSYNLITMPLRNFGETFPNIKCEKEVMPYDLYNVKGNIQKRFINIDYALTFVKDSEKEQFLQNIKKWNLRSGDNYNIIEYSRIYCEIDCEVLSKGYNTFKNWMLEITSENIDDHMTLASLSHKHMQNSGCYDDVYKISGIPQMFIQGTVVGGRTMCANNEKIQPTIETWEQMQDFDGVSLYPSAMKRMQGFLKGLPKVIKNLEYEWVKNQDGYFVDVIITNVGISRAFSLMSLKGDEGTRKFSNDMIGKTLRLDKTSLEDLIEFQKVEFKILRGYYFDEGFQSKVNDVISNLFEARVQKKKEKNPIEVVYKLLMNSSYGKSIMKAITEEVKIFDKLEEYETFVSRNYNWIKSIEDLDGCTKKKVKTTKPIDTHFNIPHVGSCVLSMSKRIMNEIMCLAEDNGIKIYYQDTDSMHVKGSDIPKMEEQFRLKYSRELIGKKLGQFHSDFSMDKDGNKYENVYAVNSIFLGKKSYIDELRGTNKKTGELETAYHIRMKGIPSSCVLYTVNKLGYVNPFEMFKDLYKGKAVEFDLTEGGRKSNFKFENNFTVRTLVEFKRQVSF